MTSSCRTHFVQSSLDVGFVHRVVFFFSILKPVISNSLFFFGSGFRLLKAVLLACWPGSFLGSGFGSDLDLDLGFDFDL